MERRRYALADIFAEFSSEEFDVGEPIDNEIPNNEGELSKLTSVLSPFKLSPSDILLHFSLNSFRQYL